MKKRYIFFTLLLLGIGLLVFALYNVPIQDIAQIYLNARWYTVVAYFIVSALIMLVLTWKWKIILKAIGYNINFGRLLQYRFAGYAINFMMPVAGLTGEPARAALLSRDNVPFKPALSTLIVDKSIEYIINIICFLIGMAIVFFIYKYKAETSFFLLIFSIMMLYTVVMSVYSYFHGEPFMSVWFKRLRLTKIKFLKKPEKQLMDVEEKVLEFYKDTPKPFYKLIALNILLWGLMFLEYKFALLILGFNAPIIGIFLVLIFVGLSQLLPVPAELGALEVGQLSAARLLGLQPALAIALSFLIRFRDMLWAIVGFSVFSFIGISYFKDLFKKEEK